MDQDRRLESSSTGEFTHADDASPRAPGRRTLTSSLRGGPTAEQVVQRMLQYLGVEPARDADVHDVAASGFAGGGEALPHLDAVQRAFGRHDVSGVRAHVGGAASTAADELGARAYASGDQVAFAESPDLFLVAHEAAHVVQQRGGVQLSGGVGEAGDVYEQHADEVAAAVVRGESVESLLDELASQSTGSGVQRSVQLDTRIRAEVVGHASPRWESANEQGRVDNNLQLSNQRAEEVRRYLEEMIQQGMHERGQQCQVAVQCRAINHDGAVAHAEGETATTREAGGNRRANDASMRRVEIRVTITRDAPGAPAGESVVEEETTPEQCAPNATRRWAIKLGVSGGAGHAGLGGAFALGRLKNLRTNQEAPGHFVGGGIGTGLQTPGADPGWGDWSEFQTRRPVTFEDFNGTVARLTTVGIGAAVIGYSIAYIGFPRLGVTSVYVGGPNMGALGADLGTNPLGVWNVSGQPPGPICEPARTVQRGYTQAVPTQRTQADTHSHTVHFATGQSTISDAEMAQMQQFVRGLLESTG
jgi:hypothetical protein